jgi:hypothetical protein
VLEDRKETQEMCKGLRKKQCSAPCFAENILNEKKAQREAEEGRNH